MSVPDQTPLSIRLKIAPANMARAQRWGDYFFACSLQNALEDRGHSVEIDARDQWYVDTAPGGVDLVLRGYGGFEPIPGRASLLWVISHPGNLDAQEMASYHHIFTAAGGGLRKLRRMVGGGRVSHLFQATDPQIMQPYDPDIGDMAVEPGAILFVGIDRRGGRPALRMAEQCGYNVALWGKGWEQHPTLSPMARGAFIPNGELGRHYAAAGVVLNDHWRDMRLNGLVSNRVFDVLACGAPLVSDNVRALPADLADWVYTFTDEESFRAGVDAALAETPERRAERRAFAQVVRRDHSFAARAATIEDHARRVLAAL
jgi:hypothetical protein